MLTIAKIGRLQRNIGRARFMVAATPLALIPAWLGFAPSAAAQNSEAPAYINTIKVPDFAEKEDNWSIPSSKDPEKSGNEIIDTEAGICKKAVRFNLKVGPTSQPWSTSAVYHIRVAIPKDADMVFKFWARSPDNLQIGPMMEERQAPFSKSMGKQFKLTPDWTEYEVRGKAKRDYEAGKSHITIYMGYANNTGAVELTGVRLYIGTLPPVNEKGLTVPPEELLQTGLPPLEGTNLVRNGDFAQSLADWDGVATNPRCKAAVQDVKDPRFARFLNIVGAPRTDDKPWSIAPRQVLSAPIKKGENIVVRAWLRSPQAGKVAVILEQNKAPFAKSIDTLLRLSPEWKQYEVRGVAAQDFPAGSARFSLYLAYDPITVDIANLQVVKVP